MCFTSGVAVLLLYCVLNLLLVHYNFDLLMLYLFLFCPVHLIVRDFILFLDFFNDLVSIHQTRSSPIQKCRSLVCLFSFAVVTSKGLTIRNFVSDVCPSVCFFVFVLFCCCFLLFVCCF